MEASLHYPNAPITEAIIDLRVVPRAETQLHDLEETQSGEERSYPRKDKIFEAVGLLEVRAGKSASASAAQQQSGFKFTSEDGKYIWQSRFDGFTFSRLAPYESWVPFRDEAKRLWIQYRARTAPQTIDRLAVRYINRIDIPGQTIDLKDYFRTSPEVSSDLPQQLAAFFLQLRIPQPDLPGHALINQTIVPPAREGVISVVLDVDLFRKADAPSDDVAIWDFFEHLHDRKNTIFEACITDRTRELFQKCH
jgi:uncharacterized protein (TIGR04255 family)